MAVTQHMFFVSVTDCNDREVLEKIQKGANGRTVRTITSFVTSPSNQYIPAGRLLVVCDPDADAENPFT